MVVFPPRRRLIWYCRSLVAVMTLALIGYGVYRLSKIDRRSWEERGFTVGWMGVHLPKGRIRDGEWSFSTDPTVLESASLVRAYRAGPKVVDTDLTHLPTESEPFGLYLRRQTLGDGPFISPHGAEILVRLKNLKVIELDSHQLGAGALEGLADHGMLHRHVGEAQDHKRAERPEDVYRVALRSGWLSEKVMTSVATFPNLKLLYLHPDEERRNDARMTGAMIRRLAPVRGLNLDFGMPDRVLNDDVLCGLRDADLLHAVRSVRYGEQYWKWARAEEVTDFNLQKSDVTDAGLRHLGPLTNLTTLNLTGTRVTDAGLKELSRFKMLSMLHLQETGVTEEGIRELRTTLPNCQVTR